MQPKEPFFSPLEIEGETYEFSHLDPFTMRFDSKNANRTLRINVRFSNHCFSYSQTDEALAPPTHLLDHNGRSRIFCPIRYRLSLELPKIVRSLNNPKCKVHQTAAERNFNYSLQIDDPQGPYHLFFEVSKATGKSATMQDVNMFVESAYHEDPIGKSPVLLGRIGFHVLCTNVYLNKPVSTKR